MHNQQTYLSFLVPALIIGIVLFFRFRSLGKARPLRLERLWIVPSLYLVLAALLFVQMPPHRFGWLWAAASLAAGAVLGWQRGRTMRITVDPESHALNQASSPVALLFIVALILIRSGVRAGAGLEATAMHIDAALITDCLVALALGLLSAQRLEMYLRGARLLADARAGRSG
jgi:hypothetical protein